MQQMLELVSWLAVVSATLSTFMLGALCVPSHLGKSYPTVPQLVLAVVSTGMAVLSFVGLTSTFEVRDALGPFIGALVVALVWAISSFFGNRRSSAFASKLQLTASLGMLVSMVAYAGPVLFWSV